MGQVQHAALLKPVETRQLTPREEVVQRLSEMASLSQKSGSVFPQPLALQRGALLQVPINQTLGSTREMRELLGGTVQRRVISIPVE